MASLASMRRQLPLGAANRQTALLNAAARRPALHRPQGRRAPLAPAAALPGWLSWLWPFGKKATAAAAPAAAATLSLIDPSQAFTVATVAVLPLYALMIAAPKAKLTRDVVESAAVPLLFAVPYAVLLLQAWQSGALDAVVSAARACAPLPDAAAAAAVFKEPVLTALAWLHLLMLDWIMARAVLLDGLKTFTPTAHSLVLCCMFGPLGVLSHVATRAAAHAMRGGKVKLATFAT